MKLDQTIRTIGIAMLLTHTSSAWAQIGKQGAVYGSSFAVQTSGKLLTNNHVVADCSEVTVRSRSGAPVIGRVIGRDVRNDLALIAIESQLTSVAVFRRTLIRAGEDIIALGFPLRGYLANDLNVSKGIVSATAGYLDDSSQLQISAGVQRGNSGGPLLDSFGFVAGIVVSKLDALAVARTSGDIPQNVNFAIKAEVARVFLRSHGVEPLLSSQTPLRHLAVPDAVEKARAYTLVVECDPSLPTTQQRIAAERAAAEARDAARRRIAQVQEEQQRERAAAESRGSERRRVAQVQEEQQRQAAVRERARVAANQKDSSSAATYSQSGCSRPPNISINGWNGMSIEAQARMCRAADGLKSETALSVYRSAYSGCSRPPNISINGWNGMSAEAQARMCRAADGLITRN